MKTAVKPRTQIYLSPPHMTPTARQMLLDAFDSNWVAPVGPDLTEFEKEFAQSIGVRYAVAVSSGTAALHLALRLVGVENADRVPVSTLTFIAPANAVRYVGARPVFIDSDRESWNMDPELLERALDDLHRTDRMPKAVIVVDAFGQCADYDRIREICDARGVILIEDAAESLGASYRGTPAGRLGNLACFSFNGNKMITTSAGGMLVTDRLEWADQARHLATQARDDAAHYEHSTIGYNYRMSNLLAAIGRGQLRVLDQWVDRRRQVYRWYKERLSRLPGIEMIPDYPAGESSCWLTCILVDPTKLGVSREDLRLALHDQSIESRPTWKPMHKQPVFSGELFYGGEVAERIFEQGLCLPSGSSLTDEDLERVASVIESVATQ